MKNIIRVCLCSLLVCCVLMGTAGCKKDDVANAKYKIFYINQNGTGLVEAAYHGEMNDSEQAVSEMLEALKKKDDEMDEQPAIPDKVKLLNYKLDDEKLILYFNKEYGKMDTVREVLCRAALVRSLTQISGVDLVAIYVDDKPLANKEGIAYGYQQSEDFVQNTGSSINYYQKTDFPMYFADASGKKLVQQVVSIRYNSNQPKEKVIVERLMKGPSGGKGLATIPKGTKLLGVSIKDRICYLNFDEGIKNITPGVSPEAVIYSIVNSVIEGGNVSEVQISINGDSNIVFQESVKLDEPLSRNLDIVEGD